MRSQLAFLSVALLVTLASAPAHADLDEPFRTEWIGRHDFATDVLTFNR